MVQEAMENENFENADSIVRGTAANGMIRALAINARNTIATAQAQHQLSPLATAALGRLLMAGQVMGSLFKNDGEVISLMVDGNGPLGRITVSCDTKGNGKGYVENPEAVEPTGTPSQPNIPVGIGSGSLTVVRNSPHIEPYVSQIALLNSTINDDLTAYYIMSEQVPTIVCLEVLLDNEGNLANAGGYFIQFMPGYDLSLVHEIEAAVMSADPLPTMLEKGMSPNSILEAILSGLDYKHYETTPAAFSCDCSRQQSEKTLISLGKKELGAIIEEGDPIEIKCDFCGTRYSFTVDQLESLLDQIS